MCISYEMKIGFYYIVTGYKIAGMLWWTYQHIEAQRTSNSIETHIHWHPLIWCDEHIIHRHIHRHMMWWTYHSQPHRRGYDHMITSWIPTQDDMRVSRWSTREFWYFDIRISRNGTPPPAIAGFVSIFYHLSISELKISKNLTGLYHDRNQSLFRPDACALDRIAALVHNPRLWVSC